MIVLDEQLTGYGLQAAIAKWYRGAVVDIAHLRPGTVIKDEAIPALLRKLRGPTFVAINVQDFWRRQNADPHFMIACFAVTDSQAELVSSLLRQFFGLPQFRTRKQRLGVVARISIREIQFYVRGPRRIRRIRLN